MRQRLQQVAYSSLADRTLIDIEIGDQEIWVGEIARMLAMSSFESSFGFLC
jgi:hypothetical protein